MTTLSGKKTPNKPQIKLTESCAFSPGRAQLTQWADTAPQWPPMPPGLFIPIAPIKSAKGTLLFIYLEKKCWLVCLLFPRKEEICWH